MALPVESLLSPPHWYSSLATFGRMRIREASLRDVSEIALFSDGLTDETCALPLWERQPLELVH